MEEKNLSVYCIKPLLLFPKQDRDSTKMKTIGLFLWQECSYPQQNSKLNSARHEEENNTPWPCAAYLAGAVFESKSVCNLPC